MFATVAVDGESSQCARTGHCEEYQADPSADGSSQCVVKCDGLAEADCSDLAHCSYSSGSCQLGAGTAGMTGATGATGTTGTTGTNGATTTAAGAAAGTTGTAATTNATSSTASASTASTANAGAANAGASASCNANLGAASMWRFRVTKTVGGHATGKPLVALQEVEVHAVSTSGQALLPAHSSGTGVYPAGAGPARAFDQDSDAPPMIDDGVITDSVEELGALYWTYDEPACVSEIRLQTARPGWWSCSSSTDQTGNCADPIQWVLEAQLEAELESEWHAVMTQDTDYAMPSERMKYTPWLPVGR